jgi:uncharacterized protein YkwD
MMDKLLPPKIGVAAFVLTGLLVAALAQPASRLPSEIAEATGQPDQTIRHRVEPKPPPSNSPATRSSSPLIQVAPSAPPRATQLVVASTQQRLINQDRAGAGLAPLSWNSCLAAIAIQNALRMAAQGYISHANGVTLDLGCHLGSQTGENIGYLSGGINDVEMNAMFMASAEHRANILGPYHYVATAWVVAPNGYAYIAVEFG